MNTKLDLAEKIQSAVEKGNSATVEKLMADAPIDISDSLQRTPLHHAANTGRIEIATSLLDKGADLTSGDYRGHTPLHLAATAAKLDMCVLLIARGTPCDLPNTLGETPLHCAAGEPKKNDARAKIAAALINAGSPVNHRNKTAQSPLDIAAMMGNAEMAEVLLENGAEISVAGFPGLGTAANAARGAGHAKLAELIEKYA